MASFDENGKYIKTDWKAGDKITAVKLNKIEESIEAVNDNDISRHVEADARLDALEAKDVAHDEELTNIKNTIADNKAAAELGDYDINSRMTFLENELNEGIEEVHNVASTVDGKIATAEADMAAQVNTAKDEMTAQVNQGKADMEAQVNQGKADMEAMVAEVEADLEGLHAKDDELSEQLAQKANKATLYYFNVRDFGAKGNANYLNQSDGNYYVDSAFTTLSDDDTLAFNNALLWENEHTTGNNTELKRAVYIPDGNYLIKGTVYVRKGQHLKGSGIGSTRILIPVTQRTEPTFLMGVDSNGIADSGGLAPSISDLSTEGGSTESAVFDCGKTAGISLYNLFITTAGIGINGQAGDLNTYNLTIDMCQVGIMLGGSSRNVINASSFFWNYNPIKVNDNCYDTIVSSCNFAYSRVADININASGIHDDIQTYVKNLKISDCNFIGNGQYDTFAGSIILNNCNNQEININDCSFRNINGYAVASIGTSTDNIVIIDNCIIDGNRTHHKYIQGSNSKGILIGENDFTVSNCKFKNIKGDKTILLNGANGKGVIYGCTWNDINSQAFIEYTNAGKEYTAHSNTGDNLKPLIVLNGSNRCNIKYYNNINWLGAILEDNGKQYYKIPSFNGYFLSNVKISANPNNDGSAHYRTNTLLTVARNCTHDGSNVQNRLEVQELYKTNVISSYSPNLDITVAFDNIGGDKDSEIQENRYICIGVPDTYTYVNIIVE